MANPTILITGANRGIGLELTEQFAEDGWQVLACCRNPADARQLHSHGVRSNIPTLPISLFQMLYNATKA
jgi:NAD(P)-dependent dehydrogenase (short-subunit alcohol dehydrogenase family)